MSTFDSPLKGSDFAYLEQCPREFHCPLCVGPLLRPLEMECCSACICETCLSSHFDTGVRVCPNCHQLAGAVPYRKASKIISDFLGRLKVRCTLKSSQAECGAEFPRDRVGEHLGQCEFLRIKCPKKCGAVILRGELRAHEEVCLTSGFRFRDPQAERSSPAGGWAAKDASNPESGMDVDGHGYNFAQPAEKPTEPPSPAGAFTTEAPFVANFPSKSKKPMRRKGAAATGQTPRRAAEPAARPPDTERAQPDQDMAGNSPPAPKPAFASPHSWKATPDAPNSSRRSASAGPVHQAAPPDLPAEPPQEPSSAQRDDQQPPPPPPPPPREEAPRVVTSKKLKIKGDDAYEKGDYESAIDYWSRAVDLSDGTTRPTVVYGNRSAARFMMQQYQACIEDCKRGLQDDACNAKLWTRMGKAACSMGDVAMAITMLRDAARSDGWAKCDKPGDVELVRQDEEACRQAKAVLDKAVNIAPAKPAEAEQLLKDIEPRCAEWPEYVVALGHVLQAKGDLSQSIQTVEKLVVQFGSQPGSVVREVVVECYIVKSRSLYLYGYDKMKHAITVTNEGLKQFPHTKRLVELQTKFTALESKKERGNDRFKNKEWQNSAQLYTEGIELAKDCPEVAKVLYTNRAAARKELKQIKLALEDCTAAIDLDSAFTRAYTRRGRCHMELQDFDKAIADFRSAQKCGASAQDVQSHIKEVERRRDAEKSPKADYYTLLGLSQHFSSHDEKAKQDLKIKYRNLCMRWHPDKVAPGEDKAEAEKKFKMISEAYSTLSDPVKRQEYDRSLMAQRRSTSFSNYGQYHHQHGARGYHGYGHGHGPTYGGFGGY